MGRADWSLWWLQTWVSQIEVVASTLSYDIAIVSFNPQVASGAGPDLHVGSASSLAFNCLLTNELLSFLNRGTAASRIANG